MSAAEPAIPNHQTLNGLDGAAVIDITKRGAKRAARTARGRWQAMTHHQPHGTDQPERTLAEQFADEVVEAAFNAMSPPRTLTDPDTEAAYLMTLRLVEQVLQGAEQKDIVSQQQHAKLADLLEGMKAVPGLL
jgi:hypothetical protein